MCFLCIQERDPARPQVPTIPRHLRLICILRLYIILPSSHDVKGLVVPPPLPIPHVQKSCRESTLDLHPQDVGQENCSLAGGSLWLLSIPFTLFNRHKVNLADLRIGVRSTLRAEHILSLVLVHANELLAPFSQVDDVCTFSRASLKYKGRAKEFQCTWWLVPSAI